MELHSVFSLEDSVAVVREWLDKVGFKDEYATLKSGAGAAASGSAAASKK